MSNLRIISICWDDLVALAKTGHSAFSRSTNGKVYINIKVVDKKEQDQYNNDVAVLLNPIKDRREDPSENSCFIGNGNKIQSQSTPNTATNPIRLDASEEHFNTSAS